MFGFLFGATGLGENERLQKAHAALERYLRQMQGVPRTKDDGRRKKQENRMIRVKGFEQALCELEQSVFGARMYGERVAGLAAEPETPKDRQNYFRYIYFYKNSFIRIFSLLDKLGYFMDDLLDLQTSRVKRRFSYYTALRQMRARNVHEQLEKRLYELKIRHKDEMNKLRNERNLEIHMVNVELLDDLMHVLRGKEGDPPPENIAENLADLQKGMDMVCGALTIVFDYLADRRIY